MDIDQAKRSLTPGPLLTPGTTIAPQAIDFSPLLPAQVALGSEDSQGVVEVAEGVQVVSNGSDNSVAVATNAPPPPPPEVQEKLAKIQVREKKKNRER